MNTSENFTGHGSKYTNNTSQDYLKFKQYPNHAMTSMFHNHNFLLFRNERRRNEERNPTLEPSLKQLFKFGEESLQGLGIICDRVATRLLPGFLYLFYAVCFCKQQNQMH